MVEVVRRIRAQRRTLPVCTPTGRDEAADRLAALAAGADDCLVKPFAADEPAARPQAMVRLHRSGDTPGRWTVTSSTSSSVACAASLRRPGSSSVPGDGFVVTP
jgi:DNA-binding response OmpR family regulator